MTDTDRRPAKLEIGRVFSDTFAVIRHRPLVLFIPTLLLSFPGAGFNYVNLQRTAAGAATAASPLAGFNPAFVLIFVAILPVLALVGAAVIASQMYVAVSDLEGRRPDLGEIIGVSLRKMLPTIGLMILWALGVTFGLILLIVPGIILAMVWSASLPAVVAEQPGVFGAFSRSRDLTRGNRWRIFGFLILVWLAASILEGVIIGVIGVAGLMAGHQGPNPLSIVLLSLLGAAYSVVLYVALAAIFVQLRNLKSGGAEAVAAGVFD
jgi:uncharacterized membrane protein